MIHRRLGPILEWSLLFFTFLAGTLIAQTDRATLRGTVTDPSGAVVQNAQVVIQEQDTNIEARKLTSGENGIFEAPGLKPGAYRVKVDAAGFHDFVEDNLLLEPGQIRRLDVALKMGAAAETVTVQGGAALIETETGAIAAEIDKKQFLLRPQVDVYPSPVSLMVTTGGIQGNGWMMNMAGISDRNKQTWAFDGMPNDTTGDQADNPSFFETVEVNTVNTAANTARATSFNMISKRGSNDWHLMAYYGYISSAMDARPYFSPSNTPYINHEAEGNASGPIIKNRTFFYFGWFYEVQPLGTWSNGSVPTLQMRNGDFSQFSTVIKDPLNNNAPFPNQQIPVSRFSQVSQNVMNLYMPKPNQGGPNTFTNNFGFQFPFSGNNYMGRWPYFRIDQKISDKNNLYVRWMQRYTPNNNLSSPYPWATATHLRDHRQTVVSDTHLFTPHLVNVFSFAHQTDLILYGEDQNRVTPLSGGDVVKAIGLQGVNSGNYNTEGFPTMTISGISTMSLAAGGIDNVQVSNGINTYRESLSWSKGKHVLQAGFDAADMWYLTGTVNVQVYGNFTFNGSITGNGFSDFLLGVPYNSVRMVNPLVNPSSHTHQAGAYITDTFKITPKLTLDYGLRWDYYGIGRYDNAPMYNFNMQTGSVVVSKSDLSQVSALYPANIPITTGQVVPNPSLRNYRPRFSAAYRLTDKFVLRGGYGEFTDSWDANSRTPGSSPFQIAQSYNNVISSSGPLFMFPNPFPSSLAAATVASQSVTVLPLDTKNGTIRQFNATLEREIHGLGVRLTYLGMRNTGMNYGTYNMNKPLPSTTTFVQSMRPYPLFNSVNVFGTNGKTHYNALQMDVQRRVGSFVFNSNFAWSKSMYNWADTENPYAITDKWARDASNREKYWVTNFTYQLPFGKQRPFLAHAPKAADYLVGGWMMQLTNILASPQYVSPAYSGSDPSGTNTSGGLPDTIANPYANFQATNVESFNPAAFAVPARGHFGDASPYSLKLSGMNVQDLSLAKTFNITERLRTTLTGLASNLCNHPHFNAMNTNISNPNPGMYTSTYPYYEAEKTGYRQVEVKLRIEW